MNTKKNISDTTVALTSVGPYIAEGYPAYIVWIRKTARNQFIFHYEKNSEMNCMELFIDYKISISLKDSESWTKPQASSCYCGKKKDALALKRRKFGSFSMAFFITVPERTTKCK